MTRTFYFRSFRTALCVASLALTLPARAETPNAEAAQVLFDEAKALLAGGRAADACPKFEESQRLDPALGTLLNLADCYEKQGRLGSAWSTFREAAAQARAGRHAEAADVAEERARQLATRLPKIVIEVSALANTPELSVQRNGLPVRREDFGTPVPAEPGTHHILASAPGRTSWVGTVVLGEAPQTTRVEVPELALALPSDAGARDGELEARASSSSQWGAQRTAALVAGGVGVAGLVIGSAYGLTSMARSNDADELCDGPRCREPEGVRLRDEARDAGTISTVAFAVGALGVAGGALLWWTAPSTRTSVGVAPGRLSVATRF